MTVSQLARGRAPGFLVRALDALEDRYEDSLARVLDRPALGLGGGVLALLLLLVLIWSAGRSLPVEGPVARPIRIEVRGPDATTLAGVTRRVADEVREVRGTVEVTSTPKGDHRTQIEAGVYARGTREVLTEVESVLADLPLPPGYAVKTSRGSATRLTSLANLAGIFLAIVLGALEAAAMIRIDTRRRSRGDSPRVAAAVAARRRFASNVMSTGIPAGLALLLAIFSGARFISFAVVSVATLSVVLLALLYVTPVVRSLLPVAAR